MTKKRRVLLKLSGEAFGGGSLGVTQTSSQQSQKTFSRLQTRLKSQSWLVAETSSVEQSFRTEAWTALEPTTWECSAP